MKSSEDIWRGLAQTVIVEQARLSKSKWAPHFARLQKDIAKYHHVLEAPGELPASGPCARGLFLRAWLVLMSAPENLGSRYTQLREHKDNGRGLADEAAALRWRGYKLQGLASAEENQMLWLGALVRAIDSDLATVDYWPEPGKPFDPELWTLPGYPCYIVPVNRAYRLQDGKERERRATQYHAVVPTKLGDLTIDLKLYNDIDQSLDARDWNYGAAMFDGMTIDIEPIGDEHFKLTDAPLANGGAMIAQQVGEALDARVDALIWPELTVPDARLGEIRKALKGDPLRSAARIAISLAGSWHRDIDGKLVNRAVLLQGRGVDLAIYDKRRAYKVDERWEAIEPGAVLPVIVMEDRLVGIAICKDFCDDCADPVYRALGLDLVLVPSMGGQSTHDSHERSAKALQSQHGAISFIVQQVPVVTGGAREVGEPLGYSFALPVAPGKAEPREQNVPFRPLKARR